MPVHPRSRGEHLSPSPPCHREYGSSPLARGTLSPSPPCHREIRFIPARAGNTCPWRRSSRYPPVHPRSRGEHWVRVDPRGCGHGSSPLARGTRLDRGSGRIPRRFIPARAGNTRPSTRSPDVFTVHPRSRGEHAAKRANKGFTVGSSPLARGTLVLHHPRPVVERFIPARAGNTQRSLRLPAPAAVHPRSRGEHLTYQLGSEVNDGSSPLARGTQFQAQDVLEDLRFIPARAGNTLPRTY